MWLKYRKYPRFIKAIAERHIMYNDTLDYIAEREEKGALLVIRPEEKLPVGKVEKDPEKLKAAYVLGRTAAEKRLSDIKEFFK